jgi:hypothetical protein
MEGGSNSSLIKDVRRICDGGGGRAGMQGRWRGDAAAAAATAMVLVEDTDRAMCLLMVVDDWFLWWL